MEGLNAMPPDRLATELAACCASRRWIAAVVRARPFGGAEELHRVAAQELANLDWPDVREALEAHPRIGERSTAAAREAAWSRAEQSGAQDADAQTAAELAAANAAYEAKFGYIFLIRAAGRSASELVAAALDRLGHDELTEQAVVREQLSQIVRLRLDKLLLGLGGDPVAMSLPTNLSTHVLDTALGRPAVGMSVRLDAATPDGWTPLVTTRADHDGRVTREAFADALAAISSPYVPPGDAPSRTGGTYRLVFDTAGYFADRDVKECFYPEVVVCFTVAEPDAHYHVPLLLSPFGYSTYRGS